MGQSGNVVISMGCILQKLRGWSSAKAFRWFIVTLEVELPFARTSHRPPLPPIFPPNPLRLSSARRTFRPFLLSSKIRYKITASRHQRYREQPSFLVFVTKSSPNIHFWSVTVYTTRRIRLISDCSMVNRRKEGKREISKTSINTYRIFK